MTGQEFWYSLIGADVREMIAGQRKTLFLGEGKWRFVHVHFSVFIQSAMDTCCIMTRVSLVILHNATMSDGFSAWKAGTKLFRFSWVLLITLMDTYCLSLVYYCNSWKRVLIYGLLFLDWQTEWMSLTIPMISFANFDKCLLIWSFYHFILDILPGTWVFNWSGVLGTIGAPSHWYRGVYNSPWIEPVKNEFLFTGGWPNRSLVAGSESLFET